ncbi:MAG: hypothetical protein EXQ95_07830 [Alphaproteobacteria bacterium]|nr:hypothetical protein [Alphaproteobacteria bacterium]
MTRIEALTEAKDPARPETNEDRIVILPGRAYAVIDGATDKSGKRWDGLTGGQIAAATVAETVTALAVSGEPAPSGRELVGRIAGAIRAHYVRLGIEAEAEADPLGRFSATLALALAVPGGWRLYRIGDSGIRLNGTDTLIEESALDPVYSLFRAALWRRFVALGLPVDEVDRRSRLRLVEGATHPSEDAALAAEARDEAIERVVARSPFLDAGEIRQILDRGLTRQSDYRGDDGHIYRGREHPLGYGPLDGWPIPDRFIHVDNRTAEAVRTVELFTDGYYGIASAPRVADWEDWLEAVQREDPHRVGRFASTKGSAPGRNADDRSVVIVDLGPGGRR